MSELNEHLQWIADYIANNDKNYVGGVFERDDTDEEFTLSINKADAMRNLSDQIAQLQAEKAELIEMIKEFRDYADPCHPISGKSKDLLNKLQ